MAILKVAQMGHPILRKVAKTISEKDIKSPEIQTLIDNMIETMHEYDGVGLAAPQVHQAIQIAVMEIVGENPRYPDEDEVPITVFINPKITPLTKKTMGVWEGCLSVKGMRGLVHRPDHIRLEALDRKGKRLDLEFKGFPAIAVQHETDHLFGKLFIDRMDDLSKLVFLDEYKKYYLGEDEPDLD
jgi:peptide deformylase